MLPCTCAQKAFRRMGSVSLGRGDLAAAAALDELYRENERIAKGASCGSRREQMPDLSPEVIGDVEISGPGRTMGPCCCVYVTALPRARCLLPPLHPQLPANEFKEFQRRASVGGSATGAGVESGLDAARRAVARRHKDGGQTGEYQELPGPPVTGKE